MNTEIKDGFTKIESEKQLREQPDGFYIFVNKGGLESRAIKRHDVWADAAGQCAPGLLARYYIAFRHVPDAAPVAEEVEILCAGCGKSAAIYITNMKQYFCHVDCCKKWQGCCASDAAMVAETPDGGFEKKTEFGGRSLDELAYATGAGVPTTPIAQELVRAYAEIDRQAAELAQLKAAREWQPVTVEALEAAPDGTYELIKGNPAYLLAAVKQHCNWWVSGFDGVRSSKTLSEFEYSHFRLITRAEDFTPPEKKITLSGEYTRAELERILKERE
jgi:hypothetical protein